MMFGALLAGGEFLRRCDHNLVSHWIKAHGGHLDRTPPYRGRGLDPRPRQKESSVVGGAGDSDGARDLAVGVIAAVL